jgi:hypothetical protein
MEHILMNRVDLGSDIGKNFPVSETIRADILDARTISRSSQWWTAILLFNNPKTGLPYITLYKWQLRGGVWKKASSFKINKPDHLAKIRNVLEAFQSQMAS